MNKAVLYQNSNGLQRYDAQQVLNEFQSVWKWRLDGRDTMLDVGCGSGDVTMDMILPILPEKFERLVGCDISDDMVNYARSKHIHPKTSFEQFDLGVDLETQSTLNKESFDHIASFYCLMWVHNQKMAVQNLYKLLKPGGDLLVVFLAQHPLYDFYKKQSQDKRWAQYMADVDEFCSPYQYSNDPAEDFLKHLNRCGFRDCKVEAREKCYIFNGVEIVRSK